MPISTPAPGSVLEAIQSWWLQTTAAMALTPDGKLWHKEQPEVASVPFAFPYITYFRVAEPVEERTTAAAIVRAVVQFNCHAATAGGAESLAVQLRDLLTKSRAQPSGARLLVAGIPVTHVLDEDISLELGEGLGPGGSDCWLGYITIEVYFTR